MNDSESKEVVLDQATKNNVEVLVFQLEELQRMEELRHKIVFIASAVVAMTVVAMINRGLSTMIVGILVYAISLISFELIGKTIQHRSNQRITNYINQVLNECSDTHQTIFTYIHQNYVMLRTYNKRYLKTT